MLKPLSYEITIDEKEIQDAKVINAFNHIIHRLLHVFFAIAGQFFHLIVLELCLILQWMPIDELIGQPFYQEDHLSKKAIEICLAANEDRYSGFIPHQLASKFDGQLSYLYYDESNKI
jgi:hypothetical protein